MLAEISLYLSVRLKPICFFRLSDNQFEVDPVTRQELIMDYWSGSSFESDLVKLSILKTYYE